MKDVYKLDLEYQYSMLAHHASEIIKLAETWDDTIFSEALEPLRKRLEVITNLQDTMNKQVCQTFAQRENADGMPGTDNLPEFDFYPVLEDDVGDGIWDDGDAITVNQWPSSQLCMDCEHGMFIMGEDIPASAYACKQGVQLRPCDSSCVMFEEKETS